MKLNIRLPNDECLVLEHIARKTGMDCWFDLRYDGDTHYVFDLEEKRRLTLRDGVQDLCEGIVPELLDLSSEQLYTFSNVLDRLSITNTPFYHLIVEVCPHCESENAYYYWDVDTHGYIAKCLECGKEIFLCDACMHAEDNEGMNCDWCATECGGKCFRGTTKD